jgi:hypothetical protein
VSNKKTTTTQDTTQNSTGTSTPNVPDWLLQPAQSLAGNLGGLIAAGPGATTPTESALQKQATTSAGALTTSPQFGQATDMLTGNAPVQGQSLLDGLSSYYNPFEQAVIDPQLAQYDQQAGMARAGQSAKEAATGAFRGSRAGVAEGQTAGQLAMGRSSLLGGLLNDAYGQATTLSGQDAARRQEAMTGNADRNVTSAGLLANIGSASGAQALANEQAQAQQGAAQTGIDNTISQYPITHQTQLEGLLAGLDPSLYTGQTQTSSGTSHSDGTSVTHDPMGALGTVAQIGALLAAPMTGGLSLAGLSAMGAGSAGMGAIVSDRRLKRNVIRVGERPDGLAVYAFRYLWSRAVHIGVMAQEVLKVKPRAVQMMPCGYYAVDYGALA